MCARVHGGFRHQAKNREERQQIGCEREREHSDSFTAFALFSTNLFPNIKLLTKQFIYLKILPVEVG